MFGGMFVPAGSVVMVGGRPVGIVGGMVRPSREIYYTHTYEGYTVVFGAVNGVPCATIDGHDTAIVSTVRTVCNVYNNVGFCVGTTDPITLTRDMFSTICEMNIDGKIMSVVSINGGTYYIVVVFHEISGKFIGF